jgi:hypothetical protein
MKKKETSTDNEKEIIPCSWCFYCVSDFMDDCYTCTKLNKKIKEHAHSSQVCSFYKNYWDVFDLVEG